MNIAVLQDDLRKKQAAALSLFEKTALLAEKENRATTDDERHGRNQPLAKTRDVVDHRRHLVQAFEIVVDVREHRIDRTCAERRRLGEINQDGISGFLQHHKQPLSGAAATHHRVIALPACRANSTAAR